MKNKDHGDVMKKYIYSLALVIAAPFFVQVASAEADVKSTDIFKQEIELTIGALETQRKLVLVEALALTAGDSEFWKVYNNYRKAMKKAIDLRVSVITDYADLYVNHSLTDKGATTLTQRYLKSLEKQLMVKKSFVRKFAKVLSGKQVARFYQVDHRLDMLVNMQISAGVPLVE